MVFNETKVALEQQPGRHDLGFVENHQGIGGKIVGNILEKAFPRRSVDVQKQFRIVPVRQRILGDTVFR
jgi:hypothetical protein